MSHAAKARYCSVMMRGRLPFSAKGYCHFVSSIQTSSFLQINFKILLFWIEILRRRWLRQPLEFYIASKNVKGRWIRCTNCRNKTPGYRICLPGPRPQAETTCNRFSTARARQRAETAARILVISRVGRSCNLTCSFLHNLLWVWAALLKARQ